MNDFSDDEYDQLALSFRPFRIYVPILTGWYTQYTLSRTLIHINSHTVSSDISAGIPYIVCDENCAFVLSLVINC